MGKRKVFPTADLAVPKVEHTRDQAGRIVIPLDVIPPAEMVVRFPAEGNASPRRFYNFSRWYGAGIDAITYVCQRQIERFLATRDGDLSVATVVGYCENGLRSFLDYLLIHSAAAHRELVLGDINRDIVDGFLRFLEDDDRLATTSKKKRYDKVKAVLVAIGRRGLLRIVDGADEDSNTFPRNPFPNSNGAYKGASPLPKAQRRAFTAAVKTAVMPLLADGAEPTGKLLAYALLVAALHTGRNTTPLLELDVDCLRPHPKKQMQFLVSYKRRGNNTSKVPLRDENKFESTPSVLPTVVRLIRRVIELTQPLRAEAPEHLKDRLWLYKSQGAYFGKILALNDTTLKKAFAALVKDYGLTDADGKPLRINISRLRKTFANRINEILGDDLVTTAIALGNTPQVAGSHYLRPGEGAQRNWKFMGLALTQELLTSTLGATEKTPTGRCTDNKQGEHAPKNGATCMSFLDCLRCRNYVVTGDDLYRLFSFYWRVVQERGRMDKRKWQRHYSHIVRLIERDVIEAGLKKKIFNQRAVDAARERARTDPHPYWSTGGILEGLQA